jgi:hypothetical protein
MGNGIWAMGDEETTGMRRIGDGRGKMRDMREMRDGR